MKLGKLLFALDKAECFLPFIFMLLLTISGKTYAFDTLKIYSPANLGLMGIDFIPFLNEDISLSNPLDLISQERRLVLNVNFEDTLRDKRKDNWGSRIYSLNGDISLYTPIIFNKNNPPSTWLNISCLTSRSHLFIPLDYDFLKYNDHQKKLYFSFAQELPPKFYLGISSIIDKNYKYNWGMEGLFNIHKSINVKASEARRRINQKFTIKYKEKEYPVHIDEDINWRKVEIDNKLTKKIRWELGYQDKGIREINKNVATFHLAVNGYQKTASIKPIFTLSNNLRIHFLGKKEKTDLVNKLYEKKDDLIGKIRIEAEQDIITAEIRRSKYKFNIGRSILDFKAYGTLNSTSYYNIILALGNKQYKSFNKIKSTYYNGEYQDKICHSIDYGLQLNYQILKIEGFLDSWYQSILPIKINFKEEELSLEEIKLYGLGFKVGYKLGCLKFNYNFSQYIPKIKKIDKETGQGKEIKESIKKEKYYGGGFHSLRITCFF